MILPNTLPLPVASNGEQKQYVVWADDGTYRLLLISNSSGTYMSAIVNYSGGSSTSCSAAVSSPYFTTMSDFTCFSLTFSDELLTLYVDGEEVSSSAAPSGCGSTVKPVDFRKVIRIGSDETAVGFPSYQRNFEGIVDEVRIFNEALAPEQLCSACAE